MTRVLAMLLLLSAAPAAADHSIVEAKRLYNIGADAYQNGLYSDALRAFEDSYHLSDRTALLINIALCYERMNQPAKAAEAYRRYLAAEPDAPDHAEIADKAAVLEARAQMPILSVPAEAVGLPAPPRPQFSPLERRIERLRRAVVGTAIATGLTALAAAGVTLGAAAAYRDLNADCRAAAAGCSDGARAAQLRLDHAADALWALSAAGAAATLTVHLVLRRDRRRLQATVGVASLGLTGTF